MLNDKTAKTLAWKTILLENLDGMLSEAWESTPPQGVNRLKDGLNCSAIKRWIICIGDAFIDWGNDTLVGNIPPCLIILDAQRNFFDGSSITLE